MKRLRDGYDDTPSTLFAKSQFSATQQTPGSNGAGASSGRLSSPRLFASLNTLRCALEVCLTRRPSYMARKWQGKACMREMICSGKQRTPRDAPTYSAMARRSGYRQNQQREGAADIQNAPRRGYWGLDSPSRHLDSNSRPSWSLLVPNSKKLS